MATQIKLRRDTAANWLLEDPTLAQGEPGFETNTGKLKIGNGVDAWSALDYIVAEPDGSIDLSAVDQHIIPATNNLYDLGSPSHQWRHAYIANGSLYIGDIKLSNSDGTLIVQQVTDPGLVTEEPVANTPGIVTTDRIVNGAYNLSINSTGGLLLNGQPFTGSGASTGDVGFSGNVLYNKTNYNDGLYVAPGGESTSYVYVPGNSQSDFIPLQITNYSSTGQVRVDVNGNQWDFNATGVLQNAYSYTKTTMADITTTSPTVVWTASENFISGVKLQIQVEADETGDATGWHSQVCEAVIASRGYANTFAGPGGTPVMTVYGVTYTSTVPLVTFTVQRNITTKKIEVVGTVTAAATSAGLRIYSVETATRD